MSILRVVPTSPSLGFSIKELAEQARISAASASKHLRRLYQAGLVDYVYDPNSNGKCYYRV